MRLLDHEAVMAPGEDEESGEEHPVASSPAAGCDYAAVLAARRAHYGPNAALSYEEPLCMVRGQGTYLYDQQGREYLDCINNVAHVGHCHPHVVSAVCQQMGMLNTNSRYLHPTLATYTAELLRTMPEPLKVVYLTCSGSEANDLALRVMRAARPGATHVAVMASAYHGHTAALIPLSSYKFFGPGGEGKAGGVHMLPLPDSYRGENLDGRRAARAAIAAAQRAGGRIGAFFHESILSCGGQAMFPPGYLEGAYAEMRAHGALCVADEVQCGWGRVGTTFWAFQSHGVVPDMVTLAKSMGNGFPMGGMVLTQALAAAFDNGMEYFATAGGCTAAVAAGLATLRVLQGEGLQQRAAKTGRYLLAALQQLQAGYPFLGNVRGTGLMLGIEVVWSGPAAAAASSGASLPAVAAGAASAADAAAHLAELHPVRDQVRDQPATAAHNKVHAPRLARWIKERCKARRVLLSTDGPYENVLKIKPPMVFGPAEVDRLVGTLSAVLQEELTEGVMQEVAAQEEAHYWRVVAPRLARYRANEAELYGALLSAEGAAGGIGAAAAVGSKL